MENWKIDVKHQKNRVCQLLLADSYRRHSRTIQAVSGTFNLLKIHIGFRIQAPVQFFVFLLPLRNAFNFIFFCMGNKAIQSKAR